MHTQPTLAQQAFFATIEQFKCRDSSVVEHFHGKEGVLGSNPSRGSIFDLQNYLCYNKRTYAKEEYKAQTCRSRV